MSQNSSAHISDKISVSIPEYLLINDPERINKSVSIEVTDHCYQPRTDDLQSDWVAYVAAPAFKLIRKEQGHAINAFCSIGTGSGLDVLTGIEILGAKRVGLTDVHQDVVITAVDNVTHNLKKGYQVAIEAGFGDLLEPLRKFNSKYDVIYENLPNVPASNEADATADRKSSTHVPPRQESIPELIQNQMLDLHYLALVQSRDFLEKDGAVISTLGGRVPLEVFIELGKLAGYSSSILSYTWKVQAVPESVIRDHADRQDEGFGPFYFYHA
ncbi:MAG TPA: hypothetical protein PKK43_13955, partial [Spirochaetota bacterium]|nr:hypothetical protein [Spirochaetota bacterium]